MKTNSNAKNRKVERKIISIDITDIYDKIKKTAQEEIRSVEEQCKFFIKKGLYGISDSSKITYVNWPYSNRWLRDDWTHYPYIYCSYS